MSKASTNPKSKKTPEQWPIMRKQFDLLITWIREGEAKNPHKRNNMILVACLLYATGCRISEVLALTYDKVHTLLADDTLLIPIPKTNTNRELFLPETSLKLLKETIDFQVPSGSEKAVRNSYGREVSYKTAEGWFLPLLSTPAHALQSPWRPCS